MAYDYNDQGSLLQNPANGTNPMSTMQDDEELDQDYTPPVNEEEDDEEEPEARSETTHTAKEASLETNQMRYNEALADALEISPTV